MVFNQHFEKEYLQNSKYMIRPFQDDFKNNKYRFVNEKVIAKDIALQSVRDWKHWVFSELF